MKLVFFDNFVPGVLREGEVVDISSVLGDLKVEDAQQTLQNIIENFEQLKPGLDVALDKGKGKDLGTVRLRQPVPRPSKILCMIGNYKEGVQRPIRPIDTFLKSPESIIGPDDTVILLSENIQFFIMKLNSELLLGKILTKLANLKQWTTYLAIQLLSTYPLVVQSVKQTPVPVVSLENLMQLLAQ